MAVQVDDEWAPLLEDDSEAHQWRIRKGCKSHVWFISLLTDWPWEIAASLARNGNVTKTKCLPCIQWVYVILLMLMAVAEMVTQDVVTFRRDRFDTISPSGALGMEINDKEWAIIQELPFGNGANNLGKVHPGKEDDKTEEISVTYKDSDLKLFGDVIVLELITVALLYNMGLF